VKYTITLFLTVLMIVILSYYPNIFYELCEINPSEIKYIRHEFSKFTSS